MSGVASLSFMDFLEMPPRVLRTGSSFFATPSRCASRPSTAAWLTNVTAEDAIARPKLANIGR